MRKLLDAIFKGFGYVPAWRVEEASLLARREGWETGLQWCGRTGVPWPPATTTTASTSSGANFVVVKSHTRKKKPKDPAP